MKEQLRVCCLATVAVDMVFVNFKQRGDEMRREDAFARGSDSFLLAFQC